MNRSFYIAVLIILILDPLLLQAQKNIHQPSYARQKKVNAYQQIFDLKKGVLLVMLKAKQNKIDALRSMKLEEEAGEVVYNQSKKSKGIIKAFRNNFKYCPVYFFSSSEIVKLRQNKIDSVIFLNDSLIADGSIRPQASKYFVAEFGILPLTIKEEPDSTSRAGLKKNHVYHSASLVNTPVLAVEDQKLIPLQKPFPYYVFIQEDEDRIFEVDRAVAKLNKNLFDFNRKAREKILKPKFSHYFDN